MSPIKALGVKIRRNNSLEKQ